MGIFAAHSEVDQWAAGVFDSGVCAQLNEVSVAELICDVVAFLFEVEHTVERELETFVLRSLDGVLQSDGSVGTSS